ncbi:MAG: SCO family protein [Bacteroidota bacterium]
MSEKKSGFKLRTIGIILLLVVMPLLSWVYLQAGFNYYKDAMSELKNYGDMPAFSFVNQKGETLNQADVKGKLNVLAFYSKSSSYTEEMMSNIDKLHEQFNEREDVAFLMYDMDSATPEDLQAVASKYDIKDDKQCFLLSGEPQQLQQFLSKGIKMPQSTDAVDEEKGYTLQAVANSDMTNYPYFVFVDTSASIRNYYAIDNSRSVARLVEHMALLLPRNNNRTKVIQ